MRGPAIPPRASPVAGRFPSPLFIKPPLHQILLPGGWSFPVTPDDGPQLMPQPFIHLLENVPHFCQLKVRSKATQFGSQCFYGLLQAASSSLSAQATNGTFQSFDHFRGNFQAGLLVPRHAVAQKLAFPRTPNRTFGFVDLSSDHMLHVRAFSSVDEPTMPSADSRHPIPRPCDLSSSWQNVGPPRVMRTNFHAYARRIYVRAFRASTGH